jgi:hypothetical protein
MHVSLPLTLLSRHTLAALTFFNRLIDSMPLDDLNKAVHTQYYMKVQKYTTVSNPFHVSIKLETLKQSQCKWIRGKQISQA